MRSFSVNSRANILKNQKLINTQAREINKNMSKISPSKILLSKPSLDIGEEFEIYSPKLVNDKEYNDFLKDFGVDLNKCLIITDKNAFLKYLTSLKETLDLIIFDMDPKEARRKKRRKGYSFGLVKDLENLKKEDFLNSTPSLALQKGMIHFGNKNIELVLSMMIGIRNSVNSVGENPKLYPLFRRDDSFKDFNIFHFKQSTFEKEIVKLIILYILKPILNFE